MCMGVEGLSSVTLKVLCWMTREQQFIEFPKRVMLVIHSMRGGLNLAALCVMPSYVHALAYLCFRDNIIS